MPKNKVATGQTNFVLYTNDDNTIKVGVIIQGETIWLTQKTDGCVVWRAGSSHQQTP